MYKFLQDGKWFLCDSVEEYEGGAVVIGRGMGYSLYLSGETEIEKTNSPDEFLEDENIFDLIKNYPIERRSDPKAGDIYISLYYLYGKIRHESAFKIRKEIENRFGVYPYGAKGNEIYRHFLTPCLITAGDVVTVGLYDVDNGSVLLSRWLYDICYNEDEFSETEKLFKEKVRQYLTENK